MINVVLPASYTRNPQGKYPVLYVIDGGIEQDLLHVAGVVHLGAVWGRSSEAIVVGLETKDRRRELAGPTRDPELLKPYPTAGASASFRRFIRQEVKPLVNARYRTNGNDAVLGESLAGLFIVETYLQDPSLFGSYAAVDPSLWWDKEALSFSAMRPFKGQPKARPIYIASAKEQSETPEAFNRVVSSIKKRSGKPCIASRPDLLHSTIYQQLTPDAVQFLLAPSEAPPSEFGFVVSCKESVGS
jgi:predicted alpha/beta superfamily hydrolase